MHNRTKKVAFYTLGCKLNFAETSTISRFFTEKGIHVTEFNDFADFYVINTCSVTSNADKKSRNAISRALNKNPEAIIIVTGCYAQLKAEEISKIDGVDYIFGANNKEDIHKIIDNSNKLTATDIISCNHKEMDTFFPAFSKGDRTRSFLKVQDGCDYFCAYCTIPYARGRSRNEPIENIIARAEEISEQGIKEIIISGVNIGDFGKTTGEDFFNLLKSLSEVEKIERYRIGSIEPNLLTDEIIAFCSENKKFMPHFHIPLQSGCDEMLRIINRKYDTGLFRDKIEMIKKAIPHAFIGIDLIVGVNGETDDYFRKTLEYVTSLDISFIHYFQYSERENTRAVDFKPKISSWEKQARAKLIKGISDSKHYSFLKNNIDTYNMVLFESTQKKNKMYGYTENYIKVEVPYNEQYVNEIVKVKLTGFSNEETLNAELYGIK